MHCPKAFIFPIQIAVIVCLAQTASAQKHLKLGQGILFVAVEKQPTLRFFTDTTQSAPVNKVEVIKNAEGELTLKNSEEVNAWFKPEGLWLSYDLFLLRVDTSIGRWFKVFVNNERGHTRWLKGDTMFQFSHWQQFLTGKTTAIDKHPDFVLPIKQAPGDKAATIKMMEKTDCFEALEIRGDWLRIKTNEVLECNESRRTIKSGWIRWRQHNRLTVSYALIS